MTNVVEFPALGLSFDISRVAFTLFGVDIYWYGILIGIGMALGVFQAFRISKSFGVDPDRLVDVIICGFIGAIVCARLYYVLFVDSGVEYNSFMDVINMRKGGLAIYGGIIGAALGGIVGCKWRQVPLFPTLDMASMGFLIGQALGRWGNFFNQEAFGNTTTGIFGMRSAATVAYLQNHEAWLISKGMPVDPNMPVHPTFLYESLWCLAGFIALWVYKNRRRFNGEISLLYVFWYGLGRFFIEGMRTDSLYVGGIKISQLLAALSAVVALGLWLYFRRRFKDTPLAVPEIPHRTARVRVEHDDGVQTVVISWPADQRTPDRAERQTLARQVLETEKQADKQNANAEDNDDYDDDNGAENEEDSPAGDAEENLDEDTGDTEAGRPEKLDEDDDA